MHFNNYSLNAALFITAALFTFETSIEGAQANSVSEIQITNHKENSTVQYPVVLLRGTFSNSGGTLEIKNLNAPKGAMPVKPAVHQGRFKALVHLSVGKNRIQLKTEESGAALSFEITYQKQTNPYYVRLIWMTDQSGETDFASPSDNVSQDYENRLRTAALLMQTFTAERMNDLGFGRKTFRLETDEDDQVIVHTLKGPQTDEQYFQTPDNQLWGGIYRWLNKDHPDTFAKNIVLMSFTRKNKETGKMQAHTALGGGNLGLFGSASVFSWPRNLAEAVTVFEDGTRVDPTQVHDDSAGRNTNWGLASTTIGATLHEMGHTFGLPHCTDGLGIMTRGFDRFNRVFTFHDPVSGRNKNPIWFNAKQEAYFAPISASYLQWTRWFQLEKQTYQNEKRPIISYNSKTEELIIESSSPIRWIGYWVGTEVFRHEEYDDRETTETITLSLNEMIKKIGGKQLSKVSVIAKNGQSATLKIPARQNKPAE